MKLGLHTIGDPNLDALRRVGGPVAKVYDWDSPETIREIQRIVPLVVYRKFTLLTYGDSCDTFVAELPSKLFGMGLVWEGLNEPTIGTVDEAKRLNEWYVRFAEIMHGVGERVAAFSFSTGNPKLQLVPYLKGAAQACDYIALHEYYSFAAKDWMLGGYRAFVRALGFARPVLITECGFDNGGTVMDGWLNHAFSKEQYIEVLRKYAAMLQADDYVVGATIFNIGGGGWSSFDVRDILPQLQALANETITPAPGPTPPQPVPT